MRRMLYAGGKPFKSEYRYSQERSESYGRSLTVRQPVRYDKGLR
jgi:hypothetical protein